MFGFWDGIAGKAEGRTAGRADDIRPAGPMRRRPPGTRAGPQ